MNYIKETVLWRKEMGDHYAVITLGGVVVGTITRSGRDNDGMWQLVFLNGDVGLNFVPLHNAMQEALKYRSH